MREIPDKLMSALEDGALEGVKALRAFLAYEGQEPRYEKHGKAGAVLVTSYTRAFASETNRAAVELIARKMNAEAERVPVKKKPGRQA